MRKFWNLILNELRKLFHKKAVWIMLILLAVAATGFGILQMIGSRLVYSGMIEVDEVYGWSLKDECEANIEYYRQWVGETGADGNPTEQAKDAQNMIEHWQYLIDIGATWRDWRYSTGFTEDMFRAKRNGDGETFASMKKISDENDFLSYYRVLIAQNEEQYASDKEMASAKNFGYDYCLKNEIAPDSSDWKYASATAAAQAKATVLSQTRLQQEEDPSFSAVKLEEAKNTNAILVYRLEHDIECNPADSFSESSDNKTSGFWNVMSMSSGMISLVGVFCIVIAGSIVADEFSKGTIKFLLINPVKRWKILMAKYSTVILVELGMMVVLFIFSFIGAMFSGVGEMFSPMIGAENGVLKLSSPYLKVISSYLLNGVNVLVMLTMAFAISSLMRNAALSIGISLLSYLSGSLIVTLLSGLGFDWARYLLFANLDFAAIVNGTSIFPHQTLFAAITIVVLHMAVFLLTAWDGFVRREV